MTMHPKLDEAGRAVSIEKPHAPSRSADWLQPWRAVTAVPGSLVPLELNGIPFGVWNDPPGTGDGWERLAGAMACPEPPFEAMGLQPAAGAVVLEPDGRVWLVSPTNGVGGFRTTFPRASAGSLGLKAAALQAAYVTSGLRVELFGHLLDVTRSASRTRYYLARRVDGVPWDMGWQSQAVHLVPLQEALGWLDRVVDHPIAERLQEVWTAWTAPAVPASGPESAPAFEPVPAPVPEPAPPSAPEPAAAPAPEFVPAPAAPVRAGVPSEELARMVNHALDSGDLATAARLARQLAVALRNQGGLQLGGTLARLVNRLSWTERR